jgi:hypothetical protein
MTTTPTSFSGDEDVNMVKKFDICSYAALVAASLADAATNIAPANAMVNDTTRLVVDESVEPNTAAFTRMASRRKAKRRRRATAPRPAPVTYSGTRRIIMSTTRGY